MTTIAQIGFLITQHDDQEVKFAQCPGCSICKEITRLRKTIDPDSEKNVRKSAKPKQKVKKTKKKAKKNPLTKQKAYEYIMQGMRSRNIAEKLNLNPQTVANKICDWFPNYKELKVEADRRNLEKFPQDINMLTHEMYKEMKQLNIMNEEIAKYYGVAISTLEGWGVAWRKKEKEAELMKKQDKRIVSLIQENAVLELKLNEKEKIIQQLESRIKELENNNRYRTVG